MEVAVSNVVDEWMNSLLVFTMGEVVERIEMIGEWGAWISGQIDV